MASSSAAGSSPSVVIEGESLTCFLSWATLEVSGTYDRLVQGNEREPVPGRHPDFDGAERWEVCARVDVDGFQFPDLVTSGLLRRGRATPGYRPP